MFKTPLPTNCTLHKRVRKIINVNGRVKQCFVVRVWKRSNSGTQYNTSKICTRETLIEHSINKAVEMTARRRSEKLGKTGLTSSLKKACEMYHNIFYELETTILYWTCLSPKFCAYKSKLAYDEAYLLLETWSVNLKYYTVV